MLPRIKHMSNGGALLISLSFQVLLIPVVSGKPQISQSATC